MGNSRKLIYIIAGVISALAAAATVAIAVKSKRDSEQKLLCEIESIADSICEKSEKDTEPEPVEDKSETETDTDTDSILEESTETADDCAE